MWPNETGCQTGGTGNTLFTRSAASHEYGELKS
jgi:hypothetical protein